MAKATALASKVIAVSAMKQASLINGRADMSGASIGDDPASLNAEAISDLIFGTMTRTLHINVITVQWFQP